MLGTIILWFFITLFFLAGLAGILLPFLPGVPLIFFATLIYAVADNFQTINLTILFWFLGMTLFCLILDYVSGVIGAKKYGASKWGVLGALAGALIGPFALGILGLIIGPFLGAVALELANGKKSNLAMKSGIGTIIGFLAGALFKLVIGLTIIGIFLFKVI